MSPRFETSDQLQPAGAGLPATERAILNATFKLASALWTDRFALKMFRREAEVLFDLASGEDESYDVFQPLLIPRVIGIEDSSRNWSVMMVLEHLCLTNRDMLNVVKALSDGIVPRGEIDVALYKPSCDLDYDVLDRFLAINDKYRETIEQVIQSRGNLHSPARFAHPWFGALSAHQWHCLAAVHQWIHRRQMQKIIAMLGVT